jgi:hypothetical protein
MDGDQIDDTHELLRDCPPSSLNDDKSWPEAPAFFRKTGHSNLSVNDMDMCRGATLEQRVSESKAFIETSRKLKPNGLLAMLNTGTVRGIEADPALDVLHHPTDPNPNHCGIYNVPTEQEAFAGRASIAEDLVGCVSKVWKVKEV